MGALDTLVRGIRGMKAGRPFYSKVDEALENIKREKGTVEEFLREIEKQPGVKKAELEERGIKKAVAARAIAPDAKKPILKQEMRKILQQNEPPPVGEEMLGGKDVAYKQWSTPGGENYREILLRLPEDYQSAQYKKGHWEEFPNVLAHIRVQDFKTPEGKKVLLVDEIQSDWHQAGRKGGYYNPSDEYNVKVLEKNYNYLQDVKNAEKAKMEAAEAAGNTDAYQASRDKYLDLVQQSMAMDTEIGRMKSALQSGVPDAPFKKNWHELAMKRVLDYAAEKGYDSIAITPGSEQAKRYDLSKQVEQIMSVKEDGGVRIFARDNQGKNHDMGVFPPDQLSGVVGKDLAEKIALQEKPTDIYQGVDLQVGGEGMKGFYDQILPTYLNNLGKQYGASVGQFDLVTQPSKIEQAGRSFYQTPQKTVTVHSFDITPQLREEIKSKGLPLYSKVATPTIEGLAGTTGAATIGATAAPKEPEQKIQNQVHFTENPDAMLLELMQRN